MSQYKVIFLDIDGTIIKPDDTIEESTKTAISLVQQKGLDVVLATGRPIHEIREIANELNIHSFIGYNGAYILHNEKDIYKEPINGTVVDSFLQIAHERNHEMVMYTDTQNAWNKLDSPRAQQFIRKFNLKQNKVYSPLIKREVLGISIITEKESDQLLYEKTEGIRLSEVNVNIEGVGFSYDVIRESVNKGMATKVFLDCFGINKEQSIAFGDGMNDKEMLSAVGEGFAMGNSNPELFQYAKHKTTDVDHSGVYNGLKSLGLID